MGLTQSADGVCGLQDDMRSVQQQISHLQGMASRNAASSVIGKQVSAKLQAAQAKLQTLQGAHAGAVAEADRSKKRRQLDGKF